MLNKISQVKVMFRKTSQVSVVEVKLCMFDVPPTGITFAVVFFGPYIDLQ